MLRPGPGKPAVFIFSLLICLYIYSPALLQAAAGDLLWTYTTGNQIYSSPAIGSDGTVYMGSDDHNLYAIKSGGSLKWAFPTTSRLFSSPAIGSDGTIYVGSLSGVLYAITDEGHQGTEKWTFAAGDMIAGSPAIGSDGTVYVGVTIEVAPMHPEFNTGKLYAFNQDGVKKWEYATDGDIDSSPAIGSDGTIYVGSRDNSLYAVNPADGTLKWKFATGGKINSSPAIGGDGTVYVESWDKKLYAITDEGTQGTQKWEFATGERIRSSPTIGSDGTVYVGSDDNKFYAINPDDGTWKWEFAAGDDVFCSAAVGSDGTIYVGSSDKKLYAINSANGSEKWSYLTGGLIWLCSPAISSGGTVYIGSLDFKLYAIDTGTGAGLADTPWPKFHHDLRNTGLLGPEIELSATSVSIGNVDVGSSASGSFTIANNGIGDLVVSSIASNNVFFAVSPSSAITIAPGANQTVTLTFTPTASGAQSATITVNSDDADEGTLTVWASGTGQGPEITITGSPVAIGNVAVGSSGSGTFTIANDGNQDLVVGSIASSNPLFTLNKSSETIAPGGGQTVVDITFTPTASGAQSATITVNSNDYDEPALTVSADGTGTVAPEINLSSTSLSIAGVDPGSSADAGFTITNEGTADLNVSSISVDNDRFRLSPSSATIAPGTGQAVTVTFQAFSVAPQSATITVASNDYDEPSLTVAISATVKPAPEIKVGTYCKTFGTDNTVGSSSSLELTLKNSGTAELVISNITSSSPAFAVSPVSATLPAGESRAFTVTFTPTAAGEHSAKVTVSSNAWNGAVLDFMGGAVSGPQIALSAPSPFYLGQVALGLSLSQSFTINNPGSETLVVSSIACEQQGPFSVSPGSVEIAAGGSREVAVTFTPTFASSSIQHGYITITSNDSDEGSLRLHVSAAAREAPIMVPASSLLAFGGVPAGHSKEKVLRVYNTGTLELVLSGISVSEGAVFSVSPDAAVVAAGESVQLTVTFSPPAVGSYQGELVITEEETEARVSLTGEGTSPPLFSGATGNETFKNTTGSYNLWVELGDQLADPEVKIIISQDGGETFPDTMDCACEQEGQFTVPLPARELGSCLYYFFEVSEPSGAVYRFPEAAPQECFILDVSLTKKGDANGDWTTNVLDLLQMLRIFQGLEPSSPLADLNGDGKVNVFDLIELLRML